MFTVQLVVKPQASLVTCLKGRPTFCPVVCGGGTNSIAHSSQVSLCLFTTHFKKVESQEIIYIFMQLYMYINAVF